MKLIRSYPINVVATPLWGVVHGSERRVPERRTAPWLQRVRIYQTASSTLIVAPVFAAATCAKTQAPAQECRGECGVAMGKAA
jgi:hypothetical protein